MSHVFPKETLKNRGTNYLHFAYKETETEKSNSSGSELTTAVSDENYCNFTPEFYY